MNPHEVMEHPACSRVLDVLAFLVRKGCSVLLEGRADAVFEGRIDEPTTVMTINRAMIRSGS